MRDQEQPYNEMTDGNINTTQDFTVADLKAMTAAIPMPPPHPDGEPHFLIRDQEEIRQYLNAEEVPEIRSIFGIPVRVSPAVPDDAIALIVWQRPGEITPSKIEIIKMPGKEEIKVVPTTTIGNQGAAIFLVDRNLKRVLMLERATSYKGKWCLPGGRTNIDDKDSVHTVLRELKEETGISVGEHDIEYLTTEHGVAAIPFDFFYHFVDPSKYGEYKVITNEESSRFSWWTMDELVIHTNKHIIPNDVLHTFMGEMEREMSG